MTPDHDTDDRDSDTGEPLTHLRCEDCGGCWACGECWDCGDEDE